MRILFDDMLERKRIGLIATRDEGANLARFNRNAAYLLAIRENDLIVDPTVDLPKPWLRRMGLQNIMRCIGIDSVDVVIEYTGWALRCRLRISLFKTIKCLPELLERGIPELVTHTSRSRQDAWQRLSGN